MLLDWCWLFCESWLQMGVVVVCEDVKVSKKLLNAGMSGKTFTDACEPPLSMNCDPLGTVIVAVYKRTLCAPVAADS